MKLRIGGRTRAALRSALEGAGIQLNQAAVALFEDPRFQTEGRSRTVELDRVTVAALGLADPAPFAAVIRAAVNRGLSLCPLEVGPWLRLQWTDQQEGADAPRQGVGAPPGALTVASPPLDKSDATPKGFYLRCIEGALCLRGYWASIDHQWRPTDTFVFLRNSHR